ncbi:hypothetical protein Phou_098750 [Phytohabitans houttuyneae]|uniref:Protein kinase domain-containing protein n=3 Tax=Phytohabitans houttuyneae TaxID=1076126 RepID=A0A6V8KYV6_9ACTN|nr:hypothetical protein Phou_098750 [Phytohabitans houttuyneae]
MLSGHPTMTSAEHDLFSLAIIVCELLLEGQHPFEGVPAAGGEEGIENNIRRQNNWITHPERMVQRPDLLPPTVLPPGVLTLLRQCFAAGHADPAQRPPAWQWAAALQQAAFELMGCRYNPMHAYHRSLPSCIWCYRAANGLSDHFPVPAGWTPPVPITRTAPVQPKRPVRQAPPARTQPTRPTRPPTRAPARPASSPYPPPPKPSAPTGPPPRRTTPHQPTVGQQTAAQPTVPLKPATPQAAPAQGGPQPANPAKPVKSTGTSAGWAAVIAVAIILLILYVASR